jgi:hypothetical protein
MANAIRVENLSNADQELAPESGFIPAKGHVDYPADVYKEKHERYAKARLEADPPLLKVTEVALDDAKADEARAAAEKEAADKQQEEQRKAAEEAARQQQQDPGGHRRGR